MKLLFAIFAGLAFHSTAVFGCKSQGNSESADAILKQLGSLRDLVADLSRKIVGAKSEVNTDGVEEKLESLAAAADRAEKDREAAAEKLERLEDLVAKEEGQRLRRHADALTEDMAHRLNPQVNPCDNFFKFACAAKPPMLPEPSLNSSNLKVIQDLIDVVNEKCSEGLDSPSGNREFLSDSTLHESEYESAAEKKRQYVINAFKRAKNRNDRSIDVENSLLVQLGIAQGKASVPVVLSTIPLRNKAFPVVSHKRFPQRFSYETILSLDPPKFKSNPSDNSPVDPFARWADEINEKIADQEELNPPIQDLDKSLKKLYGILPTRTKGHPQDETSFWKAARVQLWRDASGVLRANGTDDRELLTVAEVKAKRKEIPRLFAFLDEVMLEDVLFNLSPFLFDEALMTFPKDVEAQLASLDTEEFDRVLTAIELSTSEEEHLPPQRRRRDVQENSTQKTPRSSDEKKVQCRQLFFKDIMSGWIIGQIRAKIMVDELAGKNQIIYDQLKLGEQTRFEIRNLLENTTMFEGQRNSKRRAQEKLQHIQLVPAFEQWYFDNKRFSGMFITPCDNILKNVIKEVKDNGLHSLRLSELFAECDKTLLKRLILEEPDEAFPARVFSQAHPGQFNAYFDPATGKVLMLDTVVKTLSVMPGTGVEEAALQAFVLGHEFAHAFDPTNIWNSRFGFFAKHPILSGISLEKFVNRTRLIADEYSRVPLRVSDTIAAKTNGWQTLNENVADFFGLRAARNMFLSREAKKEAKLIIDLIVNKQNAQNKIDTADKLFYFLMAKLQCIHADLDPETLINLIKSDVHSIGEARLNGLLRNFPPFAEAFGCSATSAMRNEDPVVFW